MFFKKQRQGGSLTFNYLILVSFFAFILTGQVQAICPICGSPTDCDITLRNFNGNLGRITGPKNVNIIRVTMEGRDTASMTSIKNSFNSYKTFVERTSYGDLTLNLNQAVTFNAPKGGLSATRNLVKQYGETLPNALLTIVKWPDGLAGFNNAGDGYAWLASLRSLDHECGHLLGLGHSNKNIAGNFEEYGDPSSIMGAFPSLNYAVNQQHWLDWPLTHEVIRLNDCLSKNPFVDVTLRPVASGGGGDTNPIALTCVYEIPQSSLRLWVAIPKAADSNLNSIKGGEIFVYRSDKKQGCSGICMNSTWIGKLSGPSAGPKVFDYIIVDPIASKSTMIDYNGKQVPRYSEITLRISLNQEPPDPNEDPNDPMIANWEFSESAGTTLKNTANSGSTGPATWNTDVSGVTVNGDDTLKFSPSTNTIAGSSSYLDLAGASSAITKGIN